MVKTALLGDVDDLDVRIAQQGDGFEQAHLHSQGGDGDAKMFVKQAVKVTTAAIEAVGQLANREVDELGGRQFFKNLKNVLFRAGKTATLVLAILEFNGQNTGGNADQLAAMIQIGLGWNGSQLDVLVSSGTTVFAYNATTGAAVGSFSHATSPL